MSDFYLGVYWHDRPVTLRQYADATRAFLLLLQKTHPVFHSLEWVGDRPNSEVKINPDLTDLDDFIYQHAGDKWSIYTPANPDGTPTWQSLSVSGFGLTYGSVPANKAGSVTVSISAGESGTHTPNAVSIRFPSPEKTPISRDDFFNYEFVKKLFIEAIRFWKPEYGRVTSYAFSDAISSYPWSRIGWLTYLGDPRALALRNDPALAGVIVEPLDSRGALISLNGNIISPDDTAQLEKARRLEQKLIAEKLLPF